MKKALLIAYHFPPIRVSSGIQRTLSLTRYLKEHGWLPSVLSITPRAYETTNNSQLADVPAYIQVKRAAGWDTARHFALKGRYPGFLALPDRWVSWLIGGVISGLAMIRKNKPDVIWSTYPIATAHLIGLTLHRLTGIPWIADCRDSMTEEDYPTNPTQRKIYRWIEKQAVTRASRVIFTTEGTRQMYMARYPQIDASRFVVVPNGYDEEIFLNAEKQPQPEPVNNEKKTLLHSGVLYPSERDPSDFFDALAELKQEKEISADKLRIVFRATGHDHIFRPMLQQRGIEDLVELVPGVSYNEALQEMLSVDALLLFQASNCNHQIPAKVYEYFRAGKPVLALTDRTGNTAATLGEAGLDDIADLADKDEIKRQLIRFLTALEAGTAKVASPEVASSYSRKSLTGRFARAFEEALTQR